jgi:hypothetical protein
MVLNLSHKASRVLADALQQYIDNVPDVEPQDLSVNEVENILLAATVLDQIENDLTEACLRR